MFQRGHYELTRVTLFCVEHTTCYINLMMKEQGFPENNSHSYKLIKMATPEEAACVAIQSEHAFFSATLYLPYVSLTNKPGSSIRYPES